MRWAIAKAFFANKKDDFAKTEKLISVYSLYDSQKKIFLFLISIRTFL